MKAYVRTIVFILILALLPGTAGAGAGSPAPMSSQTSDQLSELYQIYTIKRGDCLISIGKQFGVPWRDIADLNGIHGPEDTIITGHTLKIPIVSKQQDTTGNYLILCETEAQKQCLNEFAAFKASNGFRVSIESVEADVKPAADADRSEAIRQYLKKMDRMLSLEYVLLVGEPFDEESRCPQHTGGIIPMRYMYHNMTDNTPTDIYYVFDINWDSEGDGITGEMDEVVEIIKQAEPEPLFLLGRIPFSDTKDIETVLNATMQYEQSQKPIPMP
jgi:LysM repeat protein